MANAIINSLDAPQIWVTYRKGERQFMAPVASEDDRQYGIKNGLWKTATSWDGSSMRKVLERLEISGLHPHLDGTTISYPADGD